MTPIKIIIVAYNHQFHLVHLLARKGHDLTL